jgi:hypothetical protein
MIAINLVQNGYNKITTQFNRLPHVIQESCKLYAVALVLNEIVERMPEHPDKFLAVFVAPIVEEMLFRGLLMSTIKLVQKVEGPRRPTPEQLERQKKIRIVVQAVIFGAVHLTNGLEPSRVIQVVLCTYSGYYYGQIAEKTNSIAATIILHATNNGLCILAATSTISGGTFLVCYISLKVFDKYAAKHGGITPAARQIGKHVVWIVVSTGKNIRGAYRTGVKPFCSAMASSLRGVNLSRLMPAVA